MWDLSPLLYHRVKFLRHSLINSTQQRPFWEANSHSASQEIPCFYGIRRLITVLTTAGAPVSILSQMHPVYNFAQYYSPCTHKSSELTLPFRFSDQNFVGISNPSNAFYISFPSHPPWLDRPNIWWSVQLMKLLIMQSAPAPPPPLPPC
jgi:hypothetical protein